MDTQERALAYVGTTVADKYRVLALLGSGGMGTVYLAEHVFTKRRVALKRMHPQYACSRQAAERFIRESQAPSTIGHPGIVQVLDGGSQQDGSLYLVLELLEGVSMSEAIEHNTLTASAVTQLGIELLQALAAAHAKGFIHRDIKPDNVFIAHDGSGAVSVKLLDFGIASLRDEEDRDKLTRTGSVLGTAQYMSPEQAMGERVDMRSDLWSVGALLYRALAGRLPYPGDTYSAVIMSLASRQHPPLAGCRPDLPEALVEVVERALRKRPEERFESATQMCEALAAVSFEAVPQSASSVPPRPGGAARDPSAVTRAASASAQLLAAARAGRTPPTAQGGVPPGALPRPPAISTPARAPTPTGILTGALTGTVLLCTLTWLMLRTPGAVEPAAFGQLTASRSVRDASPAPVAGSAAPQTTTPSEAAPSPLTAAAPSEPAPQPRAAAPEGLPQTVLSPVLAAHQPGLEQCLQQSVVSQLLAGAQRVASSRLDVELHVAPSGRVERVEIAGPAPPDLLACLRGQLLTAAFPRADAATTCRYPLVLTPTVVGQ
jgi:serine/threonine-protein kinase